MGKSHYAGVSYTTIDGKQCKPENIYGYCKAHQGILTYPLVQLHRCKCRKDGQPCMHLIRFDRNDKTSALYARYHAAGVNSLILSWLREDSDISAEKLAEIISYNLPQELRDRIFNHSSPFPDFDSLF